ncbi:zinc finger protein 813 [Eupeodes corollae]|uniref:zinc finger protein 813 n=1 Tax=Eupeodes corollae TaxID=290404 RepID=UPI002492A8E8|nr:zinc finger protein 813 [Eupeodes corollae]
MPSFCVISDCQDKYKHSENVSFHKFPHSRKDLLDKWIEFANREPDWKPSKWSAICSRHFVPEDFRNVNSRKTLKKTAVPTLKTSTWTDHSQEMLPSLSIQNHETDMKIPESNCRLCGICCRPVATFATNFEIFGMIQKCFPTLNIQLDDNLPKDMCSGCLKRLNSFSEFIDLVLNTQKHLHGTIRSEKFIKPPERQLKIKQEPVVNVKQEVAEHFDSFLSDELEEEQDCEQKFSFCDFPMLNTQDIINNCDIMEIINLDDPFIDIPDDENGNEIGEIVNQDFFTSTNKSQFASKLDSINLVHEHNYAMPIECKESINLTNVYKTEKTEDKDDHDVVASSVPPDTLITAKPKFNNSSAESTIISNDLQFSKSTSSSSSNGKLMVTSVSDLLPRPKVESNFKKPNIVVLNESIVKTASAFQLHPCSMCPAQFFSAEGLSHHVAKTHLPMVTLPPNNVCSSIPTPPCNIPEEVIAKVDSKSITCLICSSSFSNIHDLLKHKIRTHPKPMAKKRKRGRECSACEKFFVSQMALKNHRNYVCLSKLNSSPRTFKCRWCSKFTFSHWRIYRNHVARCKKLRCPKKPENVTKLPKISSKSKPKILEKPPAKDIFNLLCLGCNQSFRTVDEFRLHYVEEKCKLQPSADQVLAFCRTCNRPITKLAKLRVHRHFQYSSKYFCKECPKEFKNSKLLAQHRITHSNVRNHKCQLCEKTFKRNCGLQQHIKAIHLKLKPHECGVCKRKFALKGDMLRCKHSILTL